MDCKKYYNLLPLWCDCSLSQKEFISLEKHLAVCPQCAREAEHFRQLFQCLSEHVCRVEVPPDFYSRLFVRLCKEERPAGMAWFRMPLMVGSLSAVALLFVLLILPPQSARRPDDLLSSFSAKSRVEKLAPLLNPKKADSHNFVKPKAKAQTMVSDEIQAEMPASRRAENAGATLSSPAPGKASESESVSSVPPAGSPVLAAQRSMLQDASFSQAEQFIPAYTVPHATEKSADSAGPATEAKLLARLKSDISLRLKPEYQVVRSPEELRGLLEKIKSATPLFTDLDWKKQMLVVILLNSAESPGYDIQLDTIEQMPQKILIKYRVLRPVSIIPASEFGKPPSLFVVIPYSDLPVEFQEQ